MNMLFLNSLAKSKWGGGEKWMLSAAVGLSKKGHEVKIACVHGSVIEEQCRDAHVKTWAFTIEADIAFWKMRPLKKYLLNEKIDVLICCQNKDVKIGARAARQVGIQAIFARQGIQNLSNKKKYIVPFTQYIDGIITNTISIKNSYESYGWIPKDFVHVIYNGVETNDEIATTNLHYKFHLHKRSKIIFSAGRLDYQKGFDLLIEVAKKAKANKLNWQILIAGEGKLKSALQAQAEKAGVEDIFHLIGFSNQIPSLLKSSDVFVLSSRYEGMPNALLEAMAAGKANVATSVNGAPELVEDGVTGFLVETENVDDIFGKLRKILSDNRLRKSMGKKALEKVQKSFTNEKMVDNLEKLLERQLGKTSA
jgi:glycosyltransferase involved in cell wall biosynthesis